MTIEIVDGHPQGLNAVILNVEFGRYGNNRKVAEADFEVAANKEYVKADRMLLKSPELAAIAAYDNQVRRYLKGRCQVSPLRGGSYCVPTPLVADTDAGLQQRHREREQLIDEFVASYPRLIQQAAQDLRRLFNADDYVPVSCVRNEFSMRWAYVTIGVPGQLKEIKASLFKREQRKIAAQWATTMVAMDELLRVEMVQLVDKMRERLQPDDDGRAKTFRNSSLGKIEEFLQIFDARNLTENQQLAEAATRMRRLLKGVSPVTLRQAEAVRDTVAVGFAAVRTDLEAMVTRKPVRRIVMERPSVRPVTQHLEEVAA